MRDMLRYISRTSALCLVLSSVGAAQASATVIVSPGGAFTAMTGTVALEIFPTSGSPVTLTCTSATRRGTLSSTSSPLPAAIAPPTTVLTPIDSTRGNIQNSFSGCRVVTLTFTVSCDGRANLVVTGSTVSGVTPMRQTGIICTITLVVGGRACTATVASTTSASVPGGVAERYTNSTGTFTVDAPTPSGRPPTNQNLAVWNSGCTSTIPNGPAAFGSPPPPLGPVNYATSPSQTITA